MTPEHKAAVIQESAVREKYNSMDNQMNIHGFMGQWSNIHTFVDVCKQTSTDIILWI